ncbi:MltA domain-containing protein [Comamonadaceae bacterium G21597-S1]|nr:MltA domain-containing protein [Comamonadaceae bacterium G21597-S1]
MVHQTMSTSSSSATRASSKIRTMFQLLRRGAFALACVGIVEMLVACATPLPDPAAPVTPSRTAAVPSSMPAVSPLPPLSAPIADDVAELPPVRQQARSRWIPVRWAELPGWSEDALHEAWNAWLKSCERPGPVFAALCPDVRLLSLASREQQQRWMMQRLQPYRIEPLSGAAGDGLLTAYYEPVLQASRQRQGEFDVPLYRPPERLAARKPWFTRKEMETLPEAKAALRGQEIAWLADPVDALLLQIQGSGRLQMREPDGQQRMVRLAYAATNDQPYGSVGRWLLDQQQVREASWPSIRNWVTLNPQRVNEMLWSNPRTVFFREEPLSEFDSSFGPRGAQGVPLTPGRSIAVDPGSIPYGTPVWLSTSGPVLKLQRLVLAQDTGSAIVGAVRADYFVGWGDQAGEIAGRLKQPLQLWALWPKP